MLSVTSSPRMPFPLRPAFAEQFFKDRIRTRFPIHQLVEQHRDIQRWSDARLFSQADVRPDAAEARRTGCASCRVAGAKPGTLRGRFAEPAQ